jgi:hypothetical protein
LRSDWFSSLSPWCDATGAGAPFERTASSTRPLGSTTSTIGTVEFACSGVTILFSSAPSRVASTLEIPCVNATERTAASCSDSTPTIAASAPAPACSRRSSSVARAPAVARCPAKVTVSTAIRRPISACTHVRRYQGRGRSGRRRCTGRRCSETAI